MRRGPSLCAAALVVCVAGSGRAQSPPAPTPAPTMDACAQVYEGAQQLIRAGALLRSRAELSSCESTCPATLAKDCETWHADVERKIPSLQVSAKVADGSDPGVLRVRVDGAPVAEPLVGALIDVDPGKHVLTFESSARARVDVMVDVPVGRKGYAVDVRFPAVDPLVPVPPLPPPPPRSTSVAPLVLGAVGLAAISGGAALGVKGQLDRTQLVNTCAPHCQQSSVDAIRQEWNAGAVAGAAGGAVVLAATVWAILDARSTIAPTRPARPASRALPPYPRSAPAVAVIPVLGPRSLGLAGRF